MTVDKTKHDVRHHAICDRCGWTNYHTDYEPLRDLIDCGEGRAVCEECITVQELAEIRIEAQRETP